MWILEERTGLGPVPQTGTLLARCCGHHEVRLLVWRLSGRFCHEGDYHVHPDPKGAGHYTPRTLAGLASEALFSVLGEEKPSSLRDGPGWARGQRARQWFFHRQRGVGLLHLLKAFQQDLSLPAERSNRQQGEL